MWELDHKEGWTPKNWYFRTVVLEKTLESPLDSKETNQTIWKETNLEYSLEGLMLKLKLQYFGHLMRRNNRLEKTLMLGKTEGRKRRERQRMKMVGWHHGLNGYVGANARRWWRIGKPGILQSMRKQRAGHDWATKQRQQKITFYTLLPHVPFFALQKKLEFKPREDGSLGHESTIFLIWSLSE